MPLLTGSRIGPYEVTGLIGAGGMGEVYRARDTRLNRDVALKILPDLFAADPDRLARFKREAQVLASLNHPNIAAIYGFEDGPAEAGPYVPEGVGAGFSRPVQALVLEFVNGPTLADRIADGPLPIDEALPIARQIAEALEAAHEQGIVHRDLKPANIKVRPDGTVKVLDFGLAKVFEGAPATAGTALSMSPTITSPAATRIGVILGTAAYMSPEQARGKPVDKRSDLWAFGCVLYEMLAGQRAFGGDDVTDTLAAIVRGEPEWARLPHNTPVRIRATVKRCLEKDLRRRLRDIGDARLDIEDTLTGAADPAGITSGDVAHGREKVAWIAASVAIIALVGMTGRSYFGSALGETPAYVASIDAPVDATFTYPGSPAAFMALSPDGRRIVFSAAGTLPSAAGSATAASMLWIRDLDSTVARPRPGTTGTPGYLCWSPDGRSVAFRAQGQLKKVDISGGPPTVLSDEAGQGGCSWNADGVIIFRPRANGPLHRVSASGGTIAPVTTLDASAAETTHAFPSFLPDGRRFLYSAVGGGRAMTYVGALDAADRTFVMQGAGNVHFSRGHLLFVRDRTLLAQAFDPATLRVAGDPMSIAQDVSLGSAVGGGEIEGGAFAVSPSGLLAYRTGSAELLSRLIWFDRSGRLARAVSDIGDYIDLELSPDRTRAAVGALDPARRTRDVWVFDVVRGLRTTRVTFDAPSEQAPVWSPDATRIAFLSNTGAALSEVRAKDATGSGPAELLGQGNPRSWSPNGRYLIATVRNDLWLLPVGTGETPVPLMETPFAENFGQFSSDGRWIAFHSNESGRNEVYVIPFPGPGPKERVSPSGGVYPRWRRDGAELFYLNDDNNTLVAVSVDGRGSTFKVGELRPLFEIHPRIAGYPYDVSADGQRFLVNTLVEEGDITARAGPNAAGRNPITLVVNWPALLQP